MKNRHRIYLQSHTGAKDPPISMQPVRLNKPLKSPSPDSKSSNIIVNTRSPEVGEIKRHITPIKQEPTAQKISLKISGRERNINETTPNNRNQNEVHEYQSKGNTNSKRFQVQTEQTEPKLKSYANKTNYHSANSWSKDVDIQHLSEFQMRMESRFKDSPPRNKSGQLDYLRILRQKEQTIKQLRQLLDLIDKSSEIQQPNDERIIVLERKLKQYSKQVKVLQIQNECLISVIQNNHVNIPSNKEQILQRQIRELRESLREKSHQFEDIIQNYRKKTNKLEHQNKDIEGENERLLKLLHDKDSNKRQTSSHSLQSKDKEKITLSKIKQQYHENLKLAKGNFENQCKDYFQEYVAVTDREGRRLDIMSKRITNLEQVIRTIRQKLKGKTTESIKTKQKPESSECKHQEIESLLLEKYSKYLHELQDQKRANEQLNLQLSIAQKSLRELELKSIRSFNNSQELSNRSQIESVAQLGTFEGSAQIKKARQLQESNAALRRSIELLQAAKYEQIKKLQDKLITQSSAFEGRIRTLMSESRKLQEHQKVILSLKERQKQLQRQCQQKIQRIRNQYQKQVENLKLAIRSQQEVSTRLTEENQLLRNQLECGISVSRNQQYQLLNSRYFELQRHSEGLQHNIIDLEQDARQLRSKLREGEQLITVLQAAKAELEDELKKTSNQAMFSLGCQRESQQLRAALQISNKNAHQNSIKIEQLEGKIKISEKLFLQKNNNLEFRIQQKQQEITDLKHTIITQKKQIQDQGAQKQKNRFSYQTIQQDLKELKKSIFDFLSNNKISQNHTELFQNYLKMQSTCETKLQQNLSLIKQIDALNSQLGQQKREKNKLNEKIVNLQKLTSKYEHQLKQRKILFQSVMQQKVRIQKQNIISSKLRTSYLQKQLESSNLQEITSKIDKLVDLERKRQNSIVQMLNLQVSS